MSGIIPLNVVLGFLGLVWFFICSVFSCTTSLIVFWRSGLLELSNWVPDHDPRG